MGFCCFILCRDGIFNVPCAGRFAVYLGCEVSFISGSFLYGLARGERLIALPFGDSVSPEIAGGVCMRGNGFAVAFGVRRSGLCTCCNVLIGCVVLVGNLEIYYAVGLIVIVRYML